MNDEQILKIMRGCGITPNTIFQEWCFLVDGIPEELRRAFQLVEQATLERAAKVCWTTAADMRNHDVVKMTAAKLAHSISELKDSHD